MLERPLLKTEHILKIHHEDERLVLILDKADIDLMSPLLFKTFQLFLDALSEETHKFNKVETSTTK